MTQIVALRRRIRPDRMATIHRTRVALKRFRYMGELFSPYLSELNAEHLGRMREYQAMGNIQEIVVLLAGVRRAVADKEISGRAVGPLAARVGSSPARVDRHYWLRPTVCSSSHRTL